MFQSLANVSRTSPALISSFLKNFCQTCTNPNQPYLQQIYRGILEPSLKSSSHYALTLDGRVNTVKVAYHERQSLAITDYFSGLGYLLAHEGPPNQVLNFTHLLQLLSQYAEWCRVSSFVLKVNPPTVVQMLWTLSDHFHYGYGGFGGGLFSFSSSVAAGKGNGREEIREERVKCLEAIWPYPLLRPTPVQREHANSDVLKALDPSAELFGTPWGHCGESITFASFHRMIRAGVPMGTLALGVKAMTSPITGTNIIPVEVIPNLHNLNDIIEILRISGSLRPMCLNCQYLSRIALGHVEDYAHRFSDIASYTNRVPEC